MRAGWRGRVGVAVALLAGLLGGGGPAAAQSGCGPIRTADQLQAGDRATGLTVARGSTPVSFDVEVLGVLEDGVAVGRDMIVVEVSGPAIDQAGGIWFGMSGSPVSIGGELIGAVAFGLTGGPSTIGGLTAAADLVDLVDGGAELAAQESGRWAREVRVTGDLAEEIAQRTGERGGAATLRRLHVPLAMSGLSADRMDRYAEMAASAGLDVIPYASSAAGLRQATTAPVPGGNFAAVISYGDLSQAAFGTTTLVCDGQAVAFGHPFFFGGETTLGASDGNAIGIIPDPLFGPFKLATIGATFGTVTDDRLAGIAAAIGELPVTVPVTHAVTDLDTGRAQSTHTDVVLPDALAQVGGFGAVAVIDPTIDRVGPGTATVSYVLTGEGAETGPFTLARENVWASDFDIAFESIFELFDHLALVTGTPVDEVTIDALDVEIAIEEEVDRLALDALGISINGSDPIPSTQIVELFLEPGDVVTLIADLQPQSGGPLQTVTLDLVVPDGIAGFGFLEVAGGGFFPSDAPPIECIIDPSLCPEEGETSLTSLLEDLANEPRNDDLVARLTVDGFGAAEPEPPLATPRSDFAQSTEPDVTTVSQRLDRIASGSFGIPVFVPGEGCPGCPANVNRVAGEDRVGTALALSQLTFASTDTVVIARPDEYADALIAGPLAAQQFAPVLLSPTGELPPSVAEEIARLGAVRAIIVGTTGAFPETFDEALVGAGITTVERIEGSDRFDTAAQVARQLPGSAAVLAQGIDSDPSRGWPDALAGAALAATRGVPILLTEQGTLPPATLAAVTDLGLEQITIVGGEAAVAPAVATQLEGAGATVDRVAGSNRFETAVAAAFRAVDAFSDPSFVFLATGHDWPDALAAAPVAALTGGVLLLVDPDDLAGSPATEEWLAGLVGLGPTVTLVGGQAAISGAVEQQVTETVNGGAEPPPGEEPTPIRID